MADDITEAELARLEETWESYVDGRVRRADHEVYYGRRLLPEVPRLIAALRAQQAEAAAWQARAVALAEALQAWRDWWEGLDGKDGIDTWPINAEAEANAALDAGTAISLARQHQMAAVLAGLLDRMFVVGHAAHNALYQMANYGSSAQLEHDPTVVDRFWAVLGEVGEACDGQPTAVSLARQQRMEAALADLLPRWLLDHARPWDDNTNGCQCSLCRDTRAALDAATATQEQEGR